MDMRVDLGSLPFEDGSFDVIHCSHVLEHVADDRKAIAPRRRSSSRNADQSASCSDSIARTQIVPSCCRGRRYGNSARGAAQREEQGHGVVIAHPVRLLESAFDHVETSRVTGVRGG